MDKMTTLEDDLPNTCRICLSKHKTLIDLFLFSLKLNGRIADVLTKCTSVKITKAEALPIFICKLCYIELEQVNKFRLKAVQSDETLQKYLKKCHSVDSLENADSPATDNHFDDFVTDDEFDEKSTEEKLNAPNGTTTIDTQSRENANAAENTIDHCYAADIENEESDPSYLIKNEALKNVKRNQYGSIIDSIVLKATMKKTESKNVPFLSLSRRRALSKKVLFRCKTCNKLFTEFQYLKKHKKTHTNDRPHQCNVCGKQFKLIDHLKKHERRHTGIKPYLCDICSKSFIEMSSLTIHRRIHTGEKPYECNICLMRFRVCSNYQYHMRKHFEKSDPNVKPYPCDVCGKSFTETSSLKVHKRIHTGEKPYACSACDKRFRVYGGLQLHKRIHTGEKPYMCDICSKSFRAMSSLKKHKLIHTGEKPYQCAFCNKCFALQRYLKKHIQVHHSSENCV